MKGLVLALLVVTLALVGPNAATAALPTQLSVATSISPSPAFFGDPLMARAEVFVDAERVDPASVRLEADFVPYAATSAPQRSSSRSGSVVALAYRFSISCLSAECVPGPAIRRIVLPLLVVRAQLRNGREIAVRASWRRIALAPRVDDAELRSTPLGWRNQLAVSPVSYRLSPGILLALLLAGAALLGLGGLALVGAEYARLTRMRHTRASTPSRVGLALTLARESMRRNPDDRRKALALLARVLAGKDSDTDRLAAAAEELAWSRGRPDPDRVGALADEVEREVSAR